jgi:hypothetical protein
MRIENALLKAMLPRAFALLEEQLRVHGTVDAETLAEQTLAEFRGCIDFSEYAASLQQRITAELRARVPLAG